MRPLYIQLLHSELIISIVGQPILAAGRLSSRPWRSGGLKPTPPGRIDTFWWRGLQPAKRAGCQPAYFAAAATGISRYDIEESGPETVRKLGPAASPAGTVTLSFGLGRGQFATAVLREMMEFPADMPLEGDVE